MLLTDVLEVNCLKVPLECKDKKAAIIELIDVLDNAKKLKDKEAALNAVLTRENTRSTGIGSGLAIPHGKCAAVKDLVMAVGILKEPIDFQSTDNQPVKVIMLLVSPVDQTGPHIQALASISRLMLDDKFKKKFENCESAGQAYDLIKTQETKS